MKCKSFKTRITRLKVLLFASSLLLIFSETADLSYSYTITILGKEVTNYIQSSYLQRVGDTDNFVSHDDVSTTTPFAYLNYSLGYTGATFNGSGFSIHSFLDATDAHMACPPDSICAVSGYGADTAVNLTFKLTGEVGEIGPVDIPLSYYAGYGTATWVSLFGDGRSMVEFLPTESAVYGVIHWPLDFGVHSIDANVRTFWYDIGSFAQLDVKIVPEPSTMLLLGSGLIGLAGYGRKKFFKK